jgi:hypothetical protein
MSKLFIIFVLFFNLTARPQDSLQKTRLKLFDAGMFVSFVAFRGETVNNAYAMSFTNRKDVLAESKGYNHYNTFGGIDKPYGLEFGANATFKILDHRHKILQRFKPRFSTKVYQVNYISEYRMSYSDVVIKDTIPPSAQHPLATYVDSTTYGNFNYYYKSIQLFFELGTNVDIIVTDDFIFYSGLSVGYGFSIKNESTVKKYEWGYLHNYPAPAKPSEPIVVNDYTHHYKESASSSLRVTVPLGFQLRYNKDNASALGLFAELRPGMEKYKINGGIEITKFLCPVTLGLKYCFMHNK